MSETLSLVTLDSLLLPCEKRLTMSMNPMEARRFVEITNPLGLHLRPADKFVRLANSFQSTEIRVRHKGRDFNGKSILDLTMIAAECGSLLELLATGPEADDAVAALAELVQSQFNEPTGPQSEGTAS